MKKLLIVITFLIGCSDTEIQYYDSGEVKSIVYPLNDDTIHVEIFNKSGVLIESFYNTSNKIFGEYKTFYSSGEIKSLSNYLNGSKNGLSQVWSLEGKLSSKAYYIEGDLYYKSNSLKQKLFVPIIENIQTEPQEGLLKLNFHLPNSTEYEIDSLTVSLNIEFYWEKEPLAYFEFKKLRFKNGNVIQSIDIMNYDNVDSIEIMGKVLPVGSTDTSKYSSFAQGFPIKLIQQE